jgi:sulfide dehydrogenase cytochrome subunit
MRLKTLAVTALAAAVMVGCTAQQPAEKAAAPAAKAAKKAPPKTLSGASGAMLASTCEGCHGTDGVSQGPATPSIAGMSQDYLSEAMEEFRDGDTKSTIMGRVAKGYSDTEIVAMSAYYAAQKPYGAGQKANAADIAKGEKLHNKYCEKCHADGGSDATDDSGILAGQWTPYLHYTMQDFMNGDRAVGRKMKKKVNLLLEKEGRSGLNAIIAYYGSQN